MSMYNTSHNKHSIHSNNIRSSGELLNWENFKCLYHPDFRIDVFCYEEDCKSHSLLCIKCILESENRNTHKGHNLITIKEIIGKCVETIQHNNHKILKSRDGLQDKFISFLTKDYVTIHEKHIDKQFSKVDHEIRMLIDLLTQLRNRYKEHFTKEIIDIRMKNAQIKSKINKFIDEHSEFMKMKYNNIEEIYDELKKITTYEEFEYFVRELYKKSSEDLKDIESPNFKQILDMMEDTKEKVNTSRLREVDTTKLTGNNQLVITF